MTAAPADGHRSRVIAATVLDAVHGGRSLKAAFAEHLPTLPDSRDRALVEAVVLAALRERVRLDHALAAWIPRPLGARDHMLRAVLHVGLAQLLLALPAHAAVDATVEAARTLGRAHQAGLVNALLRRALRDGIPAGDPADAWPTWLRQRIEQHWDAAAPYIFHASAQPPPMWLRVHRGHGTRDACAQQLVEAGIPHTVEPALADAIRLDTPLPVTQLPGFDRGAVSVQDGSAQQVADALAPPAGARVLDACAAPGGKTAHLLERDPTLRLLALDSDARRVRRLRDTFDRLRLPDIPTRCADATQPATWWDGTPFDAIVIDAPCSATGIVRRQPDILLHRRADDVTALIRLQRGLLDALWPLLAPGGTLLYATCSILHDENSAQIDAFLQRTPDAALQALDARYGHDTGFGHQRLPGEQGMDGFFYARLHKRETA